MAQVHTARNLDEFDAQCAAGLVADVPYLVVAKVAGEAEPDIRRKHSDGREDKCIFARHVEALEGIVILGPSEHNRWVAQPLTMWWSGPGRAGRRSPGG